MIKSNDCTEFDDGPMRLIDLSQKGLEKVAAYSEIAEFLRTLKPVPGRSYVHINMLGSSEVYGNTKNGDFFSTETLKKFHKTFQTTPAKFFKHHQNKSHSPSFGVCVFSTFNPVMHRIELIVEVDENTSKELDALMAKGIYPKTSMACRLPHDRCSICGNQAKTRMEYCVHLSTQMNKLFPDGRKVYAINEDNVQWFDCSWVIRPADPTSSVLTKVAEDIPYLGAAERAEIEGYTEKKAQIKKWADIIKEISDSGQVLGSATNILNKTKDLPKSLIPALAHYPLNESLSALALLGVSPSISFLSELVAAIHLGPGYEGIGEIVEEYIHHVPEDATAPAIHIESPHTPVSPNLLSALVPYMRNSSLLAGEIEKRASGVGYAGNGPRVEPTYEEELAAKGALQSTKNFEIGYGKLLLGLGASALLAKYFITQEIEKQMHEERSLHVPENYVKISLVKRADYRVAVTLSRAAIAPYTAREDNDWKYREISLAKKLLKLTKTSIGKKLAVMLRVVGFGHKVQEVASKKY